MAVTQLHKNPAGVRNQSLHDAVKAYVAAVIDVAASENRHGRFPDIGASNAFPFFILSDQIGSIPEYASCHDELVKDEIIAPQLGVPAGRPGLARQNWNAAALMRQLPMLGMSGQRLEFSELRFELEYSRFETGFYEDHLEYEVVAPLLGISFERDISIDENVEICRIDAEDASVLLEPPEENNSAFPRYIWAIRTTYRVPKCIGDADTSEPVLASFHDSRRKANETIDRVVTILRLLQASNAGTAQKLHRTLGWVFREQWAPPVTFQPDPFFTLNTSENFADSLVWLWGLFSSPVVQSRKDLMVAAKRFSYAHERFDWEDKIVDLFIAAEALFLSMTGNQSELKYRLKLHSALFAAADQDTRKQIFDDIGLAYDLRSSIVHGSIPDSTIEKIKKREAGRAGEKYKMVEFTGRIQEYIRFSIVSMLRRSAEGTGDVDWTSLVLGGGIRSEGPKS